ncbi:hypothetical protein PHYSODRAFT_343128 [Phytophthora sojae]|uniref:RxLR effector protein n=1 Tax=Phytophthora sojae (strain P6497) TaxID=1094619 RepID=G5AIQ1_PHYSP|nr:hypothetical protein PHYSODRAFT_343128 [Phytophthora sojae]EGZ04577.1 hypothetical protein PHYSODRAFT_343128 [Phytophthora sojae]|eukprot:XP_009539952.1 hypothetical protein PHYSODRAFT_343128 [Phytophthora sojae]
MRLGSLLSVAVSALLVSRECDATSPATKVLRTQNLIDNDIDNDIDIDIDNDRRGRDTTSIDDEERWIGLKSLLELTKLKKAPTNLEKVPQTPIVTEKIRADFSKKYVQAMLQDETFMRKMFKKWDVYTEKEILPKMKKLSDPALALTYLNRRSKGVAAGTIVTGKANINTNILPA